MNREQIKHFTKRVDEIYSIKKSEIYNVKKDVPKLSKDDVLFEQIITGKAKAKKNWKDYYSSPCYSWTKCFNFLPVVDLESYNKKVEDADDLDRAELDKRSSSIKDIIMLKKTSDEAAMELIKEFETESFTKNLNKVITEIEKRKK